MKAWLHQIVLEQIAYDVKKVKSVETGGCLMGYWWVKHVEVVITHAIGPGPKATHKKHSFFGDIDWQQERIHEIYQGTGRHITYLGDWHSHPKGNLMLSYKDKRALSNISHYEDVRAPFPLMAIVQYKEELAIKLWKFAPNHKYNIISPGDSQLMEIMLFDE